MKNLNRTKTKDIKEYRKAYYIKNKEKLKSYNKEWVDKNRAYFNAYQLSFLLNKKYKEKVTSSIEEIMNWFENQIKVCPYCNEEANSIDHIIPLSKGGVHGIENLQILCWFCNKMKSNFNEEEFLNQIRKINDRLQRSIEVPSQEGLLEEVQQ